MKLAHLAVASAAALTLIACTFEAEKAQSASKETAASALSCQDPAVAPNIRESLQKMVRDEALKIAGSNHAEFMDADKLVAAAGLLEINLDKIQQQDMSCVAELSVVIPKRIMQVAQQNTLILDMDAPETIIQQRLNKNGAIVNERGASMPIVYAATHQNQQFAITYKDTTMSSVSTAFAIALQPYGIKDMLKIKGKVISREEAIELIKNPKPAAASVPETAEKEVPTISQQPENKAPVAAGASVANQTVEAKPTAPAAPAPAPEPTIAAEKLAQSEQAHQNADRDIKQAWRKIDPAIQQNLVEEQKSWESQKRQRCLNAAAKGRDDSESRYLHMQCDTKLTNERIQYLNGYSIQD